VLAPRHESESGHTAGSPLHDSMFASPGAGIAGPLRLTTVALTAQDYDGSDRAI